MEPLATDDLPSPRTLAVNSASDVLGMLGRTGRTGRTGIFKRVQPKPVDMFGEFGGFHRPLE